MKKHISLFAVVMVVLLATALASSTPALAYARHCQVSGACGIMNCTLAGYHEHCGVHYYGHTANHGHNNHSGRGHH